MDPFTALGLAAAVVQFIDFGTKVGNNMRSIYKTMSLPQHDHFRRMATDFEDFSVRLSQRPKHSLTSENDKAIDEILAKCQDRAQALQDTFAEITAVAKQHEDYGGGGFRRAIDTAVIAVKSLWNDEDIMLMTEELLGFRQQIVLCMLLNLNTKADAHLGDIESLKSTVSEVAEVLAIFQERQKTSAAGHAQHLSNRMDESDSQARRFHEETIAAILTLKNGETRILKPPGAADGGPDLGSQFTNSHRTALQLTSGGHSAAGTATVRDLRSIERTILNGLYFRQMTDRFETVKSPHGETYEWIFCDSVETHKPWDDFRTWLSTGSGCYWINGKAGSGKSTLIKFIYQDARTRESLQQWAGPYRLVFGSFFFWGLGNDRQKSQEGLLRSLLYDILSKEPHLISDTMPELLPEAAHVGDSKRLAEPSYAELIRWFRKLLSFSTQHRYFFLIDGIDEFEGDPSKIVDLVASISQTQTNVKFLLSSRPIPVCVDNFAPFPKLHLHDLTREDIRQYAEACLGPRLRPRGKRWVTLVDQIVEKSSGVFVWVELSIQSMLRGLENRDKMAELEKRLDELPSGLVDLYSHMLRGLSPLYRRQAAELFQLTLEAMRVQTDCPLTTLQMSFAEDDAMETLDMPILPISKADELQRSDEMSGRIRSRCCGLLESRRATPSEQKLLSCLNYEFPCLDFFHRTVVEFLTDKEVWQGIQGLSDKSFASSSALFHSCVRMCKATPSKTMLMTVDVDTSLTWHMMRNAMAHASQAEEMQHPMPAIYLRELDKVMATHWKSVSTISNRDMRRRAGGHWAGSFMLVPPFTVETDALVASLEPVDFGSLVISHHLRSFVQDELAMPNSCFRKDPERSRYLYDATTHLLAQPPHDCDVTSREFSLAIICEQLLESGANPNAKLGKGGETAWDMVLKYALEEKRARANRAHVQEQARFAELLAALVGSFVTAGADVNAKVVWRTKRYRDENEPVVFSRSAVMVAEWAFSENIKSRMLEQGAVAREWQGEKVVLGPDEEVLSGEEEAGSQAGCSAEKAKTAGSRNRLRFRRKVGLWIKKNVSGSKSE